MELKDRVVLITGASMGIGEALARRYADEGARVVLVARSTELLEKISASLPQGRSLVVAGDITDRRVMVEAIDRAMQRFGAVDVLVNNAGVGMHSTIGDMDPVQFQKLFTLNVYAPVYLVQAVLPHMKFRGQGQIVNISSVAGFIALPGMGAYCASKFALRALTDCMRLELQPFGIHVIGVYPGRIKTAFGKNLYRSGQAPPVFREGQGGISAERCARAIVNASKADKRDVIVPATMKPVVRLFENMPGTGDRILRKVLPGWKEK